MLVYLEMDEPPDEYEREYCDDDRRVDGAQRQQVRLARGILDCEERRHRRSVLPIRNRMSADPGGRADRLEASHTTAYRRLTTLRTTNNHGHNNVLTSGEVQYADAATGMPRIPLLQSTSAW